MPVERILRLKEDYKPRVNPSQVELTKRDLLLELSPQNPTEGWLLVKLLGDTTAVPCWVPERLVTKDLAGFYRMKRSMQSLYGKGPPDRGVGEVVQVVDTQCKCLSHYLSKEKWWKISFMDASGDIMHVRPSVLEFEDVQQPIDSALGEYEQSLPPPYAQGSGEK